MVNAGSDSLLYDKVKNNFIRKINEAGIPKSRIIITPGNHDVNRDIIRSKYIVQKGIILQINSEESFNDNLPILKNSVSDEVFQNYVSFENEVSDFGTCTNGIGGQGFELSDKIGVYCLNTSLCSFAGLEDNKTGGPVNDYGSLMIDTRSLHRWIQSSSRKNNILLLHHPLDWLNEWSKQELNRVIANNFRIVFSGHEHDATARYAKAAGTSSIFLEAPPLFTNKRDLLGYSIVTLDSATSEVEVLYRQWSKNQIFVAGTSFSGNDSGKILFTNIEAPEIVAVIPDTASADSVEASLRREFDAACTCYSSTRIFWVARYLANLPETSNQSNKAKRIHQDEVTKSFKKCVIRAPSQFGLTNLSKSIAYHYFRDTDTQGQVLIYIDTEDIQAHRRGILEYVERRCSTLCCDKESISGFIVDSWRTDKKGIKLLDGLLEIYPDKRYILMESFSDLGGLTNPASSNNLNDFEILYLWALDRAGVRKLVEDYLEPFDHLDDEIVTKRVIEDLGALNIHRTPLNCLLILKWVEQAFDESPVNRTEMIGRVLYLLFYEFDKIPRYATRPDLKDCEYALGFFCENLIQQNSHVFSKSDFFSKVQNYCESQYFDLDVDILFRFLIETNIIFKKGHDFEFKFKYWLHFFAAHRMHHDSAFCNFILSNGKYAAFPEIIEFYTGIDRRRTNAINIIRSDLKHLNNSFLSRAKISKDYEPYKLAKWEPKENEIAELRDDIEKSAEVSNLPQVIKDQIADRGYDRSRPYYQELAKFIDDSSLKKLISTMRGAARALRNSDHVDPVEKLALLAEIMVSWTRICQILSVLSPALAATGFARFEGISFSLDKTFDDKSVELRWQQLMTVITNNVVDWYQEDLFSKKLGRLFCRHLSESQSDLESSLLLLLMIRQKPPRWAEEVEKFILSQNKNSYYLNRIFNALRKEQISGFLDESSRQSVKRLAAMSIAKHKTGAKKPNRKLLAKVYKALDKADEA